MPFTFWALRSAHCVPGFTIFAMKIPLILLVLSVAPVSACNKAAAPSASSESSTPSVSKPHDGVQQKLAEYAGSSASDCGRLDVRANEAQTKSAGDCAMQASQGKKPFYVAYDMPGMSVGVAGNAAGKLFTVQSQGGRSPAATVRRSCGWQQADA